MSKNTTPNAAKPITVLGSINLDLIASGGPLPRPGETVAGASFTTAAGGKGANQALAARRAGANVALFGAVGDDDFASQALKELDADNVDLAHVRAVDGPTGVAIILVGDDGENMITVVPGANGTVDVEMAEKAASVSNILILQQEIPVKTNIAALKRARESGQRTMLNIAPFSSHSKTLAALADIIVCNQTEFEGLVGAKVAPDARAKKLAELAQNTNQLYVLTLGGDGAICVDGEGKCLSIAAPSIVPVDTVGAGDTFCGYLAAGLAADEPLDTSLRRAVFAGALACLKPGAQPAIPYRAEVDAVVSRGSI